MNVVKKALAGVLALLLVSSVITASAYANDDLRDDEPHQVSVVRLGGNDRYETANKIAEAGWTSADTVFLANSGSYADALAGTPLAYACSAPILLTDSKRMPASVKEQINKLGAKKVVLLGGTFAVGTEIENELKKDYTVERIAGETRYATALKIAEALAAKGGGSAQEVFIASGINYPDALSASSPAALKHAPILYAPADGKLDKAAADFIAKSKPYNAYILGGKAAVGQAAEDAAKKAGAESVQRLGGSDRYETSLTIAKQFDQQFKGDNIAFATGRNFPDALAGSVFAARKGIPVLLTDNTTVRDDVKSYVAGRKREKAYVFGGTSVVSDDVVNGYLDAKTPEKPDQPDQPDQPETLKPALIKSVTKYNIDYQTNEFVKESKTEYKYQNAYPLSKTTTYYFYVSVSDSDIASGSDAASESVVEETRSWSFRYKFDENGLPASMELYSNDDDSVELTTEYNRGRVYQTHNESLEGLSVTDTYYQYANDDDYFTVLLSSRVSKAQEGAEDMRGSTMEEVDSISVTTENGLLKKTINTGLYANNNEGDEKEWQRFNGTYTMNYDQYGIVSSTSAIYRAGPPSLADIYNVKIEDGKVMEVVHSTRSEDQHEELSEKYVFEYEDTTIDAGRYSRMINECVTDGGNNFYRYFWY